VSALVLCFAFRVAGFGLRVWVSFRTRNRKVRVINPTGTVVPNECEGSIQISRPFGTRNDIFLFLTPYVFSLYPFPLTPYVFYSPLATNHSSSFIPGFVFRIIAKVNPEA